MTTMAREQAEEAVLAAAEALFYARGPHAVGMDDIRAASGVSLKRLYQLFPSKDRLIEAYLARRDRLQFDALVAHVQTADPGRGQILAVFDSLERWFAEPGFRGCALANCFSECGPASPAVVAATRTHKAGVRDYLAHLVRVAGLPAALADQLALLVEGAVTTAAIFGTAQPAGHARRAAQALLEAAGAPPRPARGTVRE